MRVKEAPGGVLQLSPRPNPQNFPASVKFRGTDAGKQTSIGDETRPAR
jgi:hypothetical protein